MTPRISQSLRAVLVWTGLAFCGLLLAAPRPAYAETVTQSFARAQKAYRDGRTKVAVKLLAAILKKYPDYQPSHLLLGHILFRAGHVKKAARQFKQASVDLVTPELAYEFGIALFTVKDCRRANAALARVPPASHEIELAYFYRGICYLRSRDYQRSELFLNKASDLPSSLEASRRQALQQVRRQARAEREGTSSGANPFIIVPVAPVYADPALSGPPPAGGGLPAPDDKAKKPPPPPPPTPSGWSAAVTPSLTFTQLTDTYDYFGFSDGESESRETDVKISLKTKYLAQQRASGGQPYISFGLDLGEADIDTKGSTVKYLAYSTDPNTVVEQETPDAATSSKTVTAAVNPEVSYPLSGSMDVTAGYKYAESYPDRKADDKSGTKNPYGAFNLDVKVITAKLTAAQTETFDKTSTTTQTDQVFGADLTKSFETTTLDLAVTQTTRTLATKPAPGPVTLDVDFEGVIQAVTGTLTKNWESFSLVGDVVNTTYTPSNKLYVKTGEDTSLKAELSGTLTLGIGGNISVTASMTKLGAYKAFVDDPSAAPATPAADGTTPDTPKVIAKGEGTSQSVLGSFKLAPVDWVFGLVSYRYTQQAFDGVDPKLQFGFQNATPETLTEFKLQIGLSKTF